MEISTLFYRGNTGIYPTKTSKNLMSISSARGFNGSMAQASTNVCRRIQWDEAIGYADVIPEHEQGRFQKISRLGVLVLT
jgi:hypothetical protein